MFLSALSPIYGIMETVGSKYPVYVLSKGRFKDCLTARFLIRDSIPFHLVVESHEEHEYAKRFGQERLMVLPSHSSGKGAIPVRNWIWEHAIAQGAERHWQFDDNINGTFRYYHGQRVYCHALPALKVCEDFTDRYENIGLTGMNYTMFCIYQSRPYRLNCHVYSNLLIKNDMPFRFRGKTNTDTDLCLQVLASGKCIVQVNQFLVDKVGTMIKKGGNTSKYLKEDGRLKMARELERAWPGVVSVDRRWSRPQHVVDWKKFDTPLKRRTDIDFSQFKTNEYGLKIKQVRPVMEGRSSITDYFNG
jgi:hypothetical protein